ncbi:MAG: hypothetical protein ACP5O1_05070 [Phycisphaerae bacterium]
MAHQSLIPRFIGCLAALTVLLLCGCATDALAPSPGVHQKQIIWRLKPVEIQNSGELKAYAHNRCIRYFGTLTFRNGLLNVEMNRMQQGGHDPHLAVAYSWAGSQKIIYVHQPAWALEFIRDLHRVLQWPSEIRVMPFRHPGVQESTVHLPNGDVEELFFMGYPSAPWKVTVMRPNGSSLTALLTWAPERRLRCIYLRDIADGRRWIITLRRRVGAERP